MVACAGGLSMDCDLEVFLEGRLLKRVRLGADATNIGRDTTNEVVLNGTSVADFHARLLAKGEVFILTDLSNRGTFVRGNRIVTTQIATGDEFCVGPYVFRVIPRAWSVHESASRPPASASADGPATSPPRMPFDPPSRPPIDPPALTPAPPRKSGKTPILPPPPPPIDVSGLIGLFEVKPLLEALLHHCIPVFRAGRGVVMLVDEGGLSPVVARQGQSSPVQESFSTTVCQRALSSAKPVLIPGIEPGIDDDLVELAEGCPAALMALPLIAGEKVVAVLYLECDRATPPAFHDRPTHDYLMRTAGKALAAALEYESIAADARKWHAHRAEAARIRPLADVVQEREREHIEAMIERAGGELSDAARLLGTNRQNLQQRMKKLGIKAD